jgi:hypothetical protein
MYHIPVNYLDIRGRALSFKQLYEQAEKRASRNKQKETNSHNHIEPVAEKAILAMATTTQLWPVHSI